MRLTAAMFFTKCPSIFTTTDQKKEKQKSTDQIFLKDVTVEKKLSLCEIHTHSWLSMVWIFKTTFKAKLPSEQNLQKITSNNSNYHCPEQIFVWS